MNEKNCLGMFIFRRDLRLDDNTGLIHSLRDCSSVIPCFILDPRQVKENEYKSENAIAFMINSLKKLDKELRFFGSRLYVFEGITHEVINSLVEMLKPDAIYVNRDYTPFSKERDRQIAEICQSKKVIFKSYSDVLLHEPEEVLNSHGKPYSVFTAFYNHAKKIPVRKPEKNEYKNYFSKKLVHVRTISEATNDFLQNQELALKGGRKEAFSLLEELLASRSKSLSRDLTSSMLSPHLKFGTISVREVYYRVLRDFGSEHRILRQLYWKDFFTHIAYHNPHVFGSAFKKKYNKINWSKNQELFDAWRNGRTGYPIVDAGMRQLNKTGWIHNRIRMIVASFLVKDLHIDWRWGEKYFATKLIDYDPCINNGNWQWIASTGVDAQPFFRVFNPILQQKKFDPECKYIKKWVTELREVEPEKIHELKIPEHTGYPPPVVNHFIQAKKAKELYAVED